MPARPGARTGTRGARPSITIRDVARRAGVSTATVSRALADPERVAEPTREEVFRAIAETGFTPNAMARSLRARSTKMVLALLPGIGNSFYTPILNAVEEVLSLAGYGMIMGDTRMDSAREAHYDYLVRAGQVDGVMLLTGRLPHPSFAELDATIPIALICNDIPGLDRLTVIEIDNYDAARQAVQHLIALGHRRIGHALGPADNIESMYRLQGYRSALADAGLPVDDSIVWPGAFRFDAGVEVARRFLARPDPPTAIFTANDEMAMGFIRTVKDAGLSVPGDVSVVGFDDIEYARYFDPALTTVNQPRAELGRLAAQSILARMTGGAAPPIRTRLTCTLVVRDSTSAPTKARSGKRRRAGSQAGAAARA
jgi:LacI family transcriptional regulator, repressor for deo operon, udp, cdd, tsx, nupC, and nupG